MYEDLLALLSEETNKTALRLEQGEPFHQEDIIHKLTDISAEHQLLETKLLLYQKLSKRTKALEINQHQLYVS